MWMFLQYPHSSNLLRTKDCLKGDLSNYHWSPRTQWLVSSVNTDVFEKAKTEIPYQTCLLHWDTGYLYILPAKVHHKENHEGSQIIFSTHLLIYFSIMSSCLNYFCQTCMSVSFRDKDKGVTLSFCSCVGVDNELPVVESSSLLEVVSQIL